MRNLLPIRKVVVGALASVLVLGARKAGFHIGTAAAQADAAAAVGFVVAYILPDPRVQRLESRGVALFKKLGTLNALLTEYENESKTNALPVEPPSANALISQKAYGTTCGAPSTVTYPPGYGPVATSMQESTDAALENAQPGQVVPVQRIG